jgi:hypothetical protein
MFVTTGGLLVIKSIFAAVISLIVLVVVANMNASPKGHRRLAVGHFSPKAIASAYRSMIVRSPTSSILR